MSDSDVDVTMTSSSPKLRNTRKIAELVQDIKRRIEVVKVSLDLTGKILILIKED